MTKSLFNFQCIASASKRPSADLVIVPFFQGKKEAKSCVPLSDLKGTITPILKAGDFLGKQGATLLAYLTGKKEKRLLFLGLGEEKNCTKEVLRRAFAEGMKRCHNKKWPRLNVILPKMKQLKPGEVACAAAEGIGLMSYTFEDLKSKENQKLYFTKSVTLVGVKETKGVKKVADIMTGVNLTRNLIIGNADDITPQRLAAEARKLASTHKNVKTTILGRKQIEKEKMGLLLAVAAGSRIDPALIMMEYRGNPRSKDLTMIVGKGITYDTGGLNLKPTGFMEDMRADMGGAAGVFGIIQAAAKSKLKANIVGVVPSTENAIGSKSFKPGDVYRSYLGKTVEIMNTDAEGRLVLADAIAYGAKRFSPNRIIDMATLTGAMIVALGSVRAGLFSNDDKLAKLCHQAGEETGELVWRMPLDQDYRKALNSNIADLKNLGSKRAAGAILAAHFIKEFVPKKMPWIHLDIAGTAFLDAPEHYHLTLATGAGVRLMTSLLEKL